MLAACDHAHREHAARRASLVDGLEDAVELCDESGRPGVAHLRNHYAYWGRDALSGNRSEFRERIKRGFERTLLEVYDLFASARFGAWRYTPGGLEHAGQVEAVDGQSEALRIDVVHATCSDLTLLRREADVAGWLVEVEGVHMLLLACEFEERARQKLAVAATRSAWDDGQYFRERDYEADVLALLLEPLCVDVGGHGVCIDPTPHRIQGGRIFLSPVIKGWGWGLASMELPEAIQNLLCEEGLNHRGEALPWHLAVARAETSQDLQDLTNQLTILRHNALTKRLEPRHPIGEHTLEALVSTAFLMETVGLTSDGVLDEHEAYLELSLRQVGFDCDELVQCGVDRDAPLDEALRQSALLSPQALDQLGDAIYLARVRVRWTTILRCWLASDSPWRRIPTLLDLLSGIESLFRGELWNVPLRRLPDPGRGTWRRLEKAILELGFTGLKVRVGDLFEFADILPELDGVGPKTLEHAALALAQILIDWPSGPCWLRPDTGVSQAS